MPNRKRRILQVTTTLDGGGAGNMVWRLTQELRARGHAVDVVVGFARKPRPGVRRLANETRGNGLSRWLWWLEGQLQPIVGRRRGAFRLQRVLRHLAMPQNALDWLRGWEVYGFPGTQELWSGAGPQPDVIHAHNLHGGYFDLRALPDLSRAVPVALTLRDTWLFSGHCAHALGCDRWKTGCGQCPDLRLYPALLRDGTARNWKLKQAVFQQTRLFVSTPARWIAQRLGQSILAPAVVEARVIPNGVDLNVFQPGPRLAAREALGLPKDCLVVLFVGEHGALNPYKDVATLRAALTQLSQREGGAVAVALGGPAVSERLGSLELRSLPYEGDAALVARYYQAADIYAHPARADTFPGSILEAMACGLPVVASRVGGIPEQISDGETGLLVEAGDASQFAARLARLWDDATLRARLGAQAAAHARQHFDVRRYVSDHEQWYEDILSWRAVPAVEGLHG